MIKILVVQIRDLYLSGRIDRECWCFRREHGSNNPIPRVFSHWTTCMREWMYNSGTLLQQRTMSFSYRAGISGRNSKGNLCQHKVSEWHICISKPITKTLWVPFGYPLGIYMLKNWWTVKVHYNIIYCCCSTFLLSKFNNSGFTYIRCSKWKVYVGWVSHSSDVS